MRTRVLAVVALALFVSACDILRSVPTGPTPIPTPDPGPTDPHGIGVAGSSLATHLCPTGSDPAQCSGGVAIGIPLIPPLRAQGSTLSVVITWQAPSISLTFCVYQYEKTEPLSVIMYKFPPVSGVSPLWTDEYTGFDASKSSVIIIVDCSPTSTGMVTFPSASAYLK